MQFDLFKTIFFGRTGRGWGLPILFWGPPGCLGAETHIAYSTRGPDGQRRSSKGASIERLFQAFHRIPSPGKGRYQLAPEDSQFFITSMDDEGVLRRNRIADVVDSGVKPTFKLRTRSGFEIDATADHPFYTGDKYTKLGDLRVGDTVFVHDNTAIRAEGEAREEPQGSRKTFYVKAHPHAPKKIVSENYTYFGLRASRATVEASMNKLSLEQYIAKLNDNDLAGLSFLSPDDDVHHLDEDFTNDDLSNLLVMSRADHASHHGRERPVQFIATADTIESIEDAGDQHVYDIKVEGPYNNFVADGFVVHNCGKTGILKHYASAMTVGGTRLHTEVLSPGEAGEGAFGVVPVPAKTPSGEVRISYPAPWWLQNFEGDRADGGPDGAGFLFLDELSSAPPALHPPLLGLIHEGRIGGAHLHPRTRILGAANPPEMAASGFDLAPPVANRLGHLEWAPPSQPEWADYMLGGGSSGNKGLAPIDLDVEEARVEAAWPAAHAKAAGLITAFTRTRQKLLHEMPKAGATHMQAMRWPSHRSWDLACSAFTSSIVQGTEHAYRDLLMAAYVGEGPANEFAAWIATADLPDPEEVLDGKASYTHDALKLDRTCALTSAMASVLISDKDPARRSVRTQSFWNLIDALHSASAVDLAMPGVSACIRADKKDPELKLSNNPGAFKVMTKVSGLMKAAGQFGR